VPELGQRPEGGTMSGRVRAFGITVGGAAGATAGFLWFGTDPLAGLSVALMGAGLLGWGAHRLVFER